VIDWREVDAVVRGLDAATGEVGEAHGLPQACYVSPSFLEFERRAVFERSWLGLGRVDQIPEPGDYFTVTVCDEPLLVVRGDDGEVHVLSNVCTHRHHLLVEGSGHLDGVLRCPLHAWGFATDGRLVYPTGLRDLDPAARAALRLPRLKVELWHGFVFAHHDPDAPALAPTLTKAAAAAGPHRLDELVTTEPFDTGPFPWNWKTTLENGLEPFHTHFLHKPQHDFAPFPTFVDWDEDDGAVLHPTQLREPDQSFNPLWRNLLEPLPGLGPAERRQVCFIAVPPTLYFGLMPDHVWWMLVLPQGAGEVVLRNGILHHPDARRLPNFPQRVDWIVQGLNLLFAEDAAANASVQRGRRSRYARPGPYAPEEATLPQMNRWLARAYRAAYAELAGEVPVARPEARRRVS